MHADTSGENAVHPRAQASQPRVYPTFWQSVAIAALPLVFEFFAIPAPALPAPQWLAPVASLLTGMAAMAGMAFLVLLLAYPILCLVIAVVALLLARRSRLRSTLWRLSLAFLAGSVGMIALIFPVEKLRMSGMCRAARVPGRSRTRSGVSPAYDLWVDCPVLVLGFDTFHYWPSQGYPDLMWGGVVERIDAWAYVHE
jgi:hypothetical protein